MSPSYQTVDDVTTIHHLFCFIKPSNIIHNTSLQSQISSGYHAGHTVVFNGERLIFDEERNNKNKATIEPANKAVSFIVTETHNERITKAVHDYPTGLASSLIELRLCGKLES